MIEHWDGERADARAAQRAAADLAHLQSCAVGETLSIANEFTEVTVARIDTRNGSRLLISSPKSGQWITLDALEVEALTWQNSRTLEAMVGNVHAPLIPDDGPLT